MKRLTGAAALAFCLFFAVAAPPSYGVERPAVSAQDRQFLDHIGKVFRNVGDKFGCSELVGANFVPPQNQEIALEYLPKGDKLQSWTRMVTVTLFTLTGNPKIDYQIMNKIAGGLLGAFRSRGKITGMQFYHNSKNNEPAAFFQFDMGSGASLEHDAGVFLRTGEIAAGFIQVQSRGKPLMPSDIAGLKSLLGPIGHAPASAKPADAKPAAHK